MRIMSLVEVILSRRSVRRYEKTPIPKDVLLKILEAGRQAPSAANRQPWRFIVLTDDDVKKALSRGLFNRFVKNAPIAIVGCAYTGGFTRKFAVIDTTIALQNMVIAAWALGIGSCWVGDFREERVKALLAIPEKWRVVAIITFGYPAETPHHSRKKPLGDIVRFNAFSTGRPDPRRV
jgi:nitroreductase